MSKVRVLLAEDDPNHQDLLQLALTSACPDVEIVLAGDAEAFLRAVSGERFDAVVLDYNLNNQQADALVSEAGAALNGVPVIVVSSCEKQGIAIASFRVGVADFIPKSEAVMGDVLWTRVRGAIYGVRARLNEQRKAARRERALARLAETDALTGLPNRRAADRWLENTRWRQDRREHCACIMVDIDHFKKVNDTLGHDGGDHVLKAVTCVIASMLEAGDMAVRWGGEEFLILRRCPEGEAWMWANQLRKRLAERPMRFGSSEVAITVSAGLAVVPTRQMSREAVTLADHALYLAKERGRDRVCTWEMVRYERLAQSIVLDNPGDNSDRLESFLRSAGSDLGPVQSEHMVEHSRAVAGVASRIAERMNLSPAYRATVRAAALMHDVGKCVIPEAILGKEGPLDDQEWQVMRRHAEEGAAIAEALGMPMEVVGGVREHHARYDSRPEHCPPTLSELSASIVAVADALVTMTSTRPYRAAMSTAGAFRELFRNSGSQFHPVAVEAAREVWREGRTVPRRAAA